jgi:hypothetical protein
MINTCVYGKPGLRDDFSQMQQYAKQLYDEHVLKNVGKMGVASVSATMIKWVNPTAAKGATQKNGRSRTPAKTKEVVTMNTNCSYGSGIR